MRIDHRGHEFTTDDTVMHLAGESCFHFSKMSGVCPANKSPPQTEVNEC